MVDSGWDAAWTLEVPMTAEQLRDCGARPQTGAAFLQEVVREAAIQAGGVLYPYPLPNPGASAIVRFTGLVMFWLAIQASASVIIASP